MITLRKSDERGHSNHGWLDTRHTFSFADYYDVEHMGFRSLRVINEDVVAAGEGFPMHGHREMEIITYIVSGALQHRDSLGSGGVIRPGELQRMSAGTGIMHSEFNPSDSEAVHLLQIWIMPGQRGVTPSYEQKEIPADERRGTLRLVASRDGREGSLTIHQDAQVYATLLASGDALAHTLAPGRHAWLQLISGSLALSALSGARAEMQAGDGAAVSEETLLQIKCLADAEALLFDLN